MDTAFCGGEANVAVSLSIFGLDSVFVTKLTDFDVGHATTHSKGASQRPSKVIYDGAYRSYAGGWANKELSRAFKQIEAN